MNGLSNVNVFENMIDLALSLGSPLRLIVLAALIGGCSTTRTWSPAVTLPFESLAPVSVSAMSAELEFDAIADGQRLKLDGVWVSEGPDRFQIGVACTNRWSGFLGGDQWPGDYLLRREGGSLLSRRSHPKKF